MTPILKHDIYSALDPKKLYGRSGEKISIISDRGGVIIAQTEAGVKLPLLPSDIVYRQEDAVASEPVVAAERYVKRSSKTKPAVVSQPNLFNI